MTLREPSIPEPTVTPVKTHVGAHVAIWLKIYFQGHEKQEKNLLTFSVTDRILPPPQRQVDVTLIFAHQSKDTVVAHK